MSDKHDKAMFYLGGRYGYMFVSDIVLMTKSSLLNVMPSQQVSWHVLVFAVIDVNLIFLITTVLKPFLDKDVTTGTR